MIIDVFSGEVECAEVLIQHTGVQYLKSKNNIISTNLKFIAFNKSIDNHSIDLDHPVRLVKDAFCLPILNFNRTLVDILSQEEYWNDDVIFETIALKLRRVREPHAISYYKNDEP
ncbi:hypothetical protein RF11_07557 [Thelohanellus kitauei]|uniref:Uncharacterized protein n=1 Tax=Thelohanellus kitauei TaxID=669202 RepID=A0A0C2JCU9_THEKT|nr:hypothetical protein RF11_07557 [Thelohanellus kitauei]